MTEFNVLLLYTKKDKYRGEELKDFLRMKLGSHVKLNSILNTLENESTLEDELFQSRCVVLLYSRNSEQYLQEDEFEFDDDYVTFDGCIIKAFLKEDAILGRVVVVYLDEYPMDWIADRVGEKRVFHLEGDCFDRVDPGLDQLVQVVKSLTKKQFK